MRDGDSAHGNPNETAVDQFTTDNDTGDADPTDFTLQEQVAGDVLDVMDDELPPADGADMLPRPEAAEGPAIIRDDRPVPPSWPRPDDYDLPIKGYELLSVKEAAERAKSLSPDEVKRLRDFEAAHRNRKTLIARFDRLMSGKDG